MKNSHVIEEYIDVAVPATVAFDCWTRYESWSQFFKREEASAEEGKEGADEGKEGAEEGKDGEDGASGDVRVAAKIGPSRRQWTTEIVKDEPGHRLEWRAKGGVKAKGAVIFNRLDDRLTHLTVDIEYQPSGAVETVGNFLRMPRRRVRKDLKLFKNYVELHADADSDTDDDAQKPDDDHEEGQ